MALRGTLGSSGSLSGSLSVAVIGATSTSSDPEIETLSTIVLRGLGDVSMDDPDEEPVIEPVSTLVSFP